MSEEPDHIPVAATVVDEGVVYAPPADFGRPPGRFLTLWRKIGGGSLTFSLVLHLGLLFVAGLIVFVTTVEERNVDFLPGGGTAQGKAASDAVSHQVERKRRNSLSRTMPLQRLVSTSIDSSIVLPEAPLELMSVPDLSSKMSAGMMGSGGFGKAGSGGGFGNGIGTGGMSGVTFKPIIMFGKELKDTRKIAVVMDV